ncbi:hypothetical protein OO012_09150 [Rhodobacteraceae bacterium KMM 6894]|nr:hypothetical protein [Rhodobacteraceae bacterium KMM 6894]
MPQDDTVTDAAKEKRKNMGLYVATLLRLHVDQNIKDITGSCQFIAALWPTL